MAHMTPQSAVQNDAEASSKARRPWGGARQLGECLPSAAGVASWQVPDCSFPDILVIVHLQQVSCEQPRLLLAPNLNLSS